MSKLCHSPGALLALAARGGPHTLVAFAASGTQALGHIELEVNLGGMIEFGYYFFFCFPPLA